LTALAGALVVYSITGLNENPVVSHNEGNSILRVIDGGVNVKHLSPMKAQWLHFNDVLLQLETLSPSAMEGKLVKGETETSFQVNAISKVLTLTSKNEVTKQEGETFYSSKNTLSDEVVYQFTNNKGEVTEGFEAFESFLSSELLSDTYMISLKLAQYGLTGKSSPVVKGLYSIAQTLARQELTIKKESTDIKRFTQEMSDLVEEINDKVAEESYKSQSESLLWTKGTLLDEKLMIGPCDRYQDCTCEIENRTATCGNPCFGRCGRNCECWMFVCGDCDCHCFCYDHDHYCSCVSKADFHCWNIWLWFDACC